VIAVAVEIRDLLLAVLIARLSQRRHGDDAERGADEGSEQEPVGRIHLSVPLLCGVGTSET
jgi:hypothetical protein